MKETKKFDFGKYKSASIKIEVQSNIPERFINFIWKENINVENIIRKNITTITMDIKLKDYGKLEAIAKRTNSRIRIVKRWGISFLLLKFKKNRMLIFGVFIFIGIIYYLSTFIWKIEINSDSSLPPYEIRQKLKGYGIVPGINKSKIDVYKVERELIKNDDNLMWVKVRINGSRLIISAAQRESPPDISSDSSPCDLVASKDGQVLRIYSTAGTAAVNVGDVVKKGQLLIKGTQGREGETYPVHASGYVISRTFYEKTKSVNINTVKRKRTGRKIENYYININGKKLYFKKNINKFSNYDKIEERKIFFNKETFYEVEKVTVKGNAEKIAADVGEELYRQICSNMDKSVKILDKVVNKKQDKLLKVSVMVSAEENIVSQVEHKEDIQEENKQDKGQ